MRPNMSETGKSKAGVFWLVAIVTAGATFGVMLLYQNIRDRKTEAAQKVFEVTTITEKTTDPVEWGKNFPRQYDSYIRTADMERTRYGGSEGTAMGGGKTTP